MTQPRITFIHCLHLAQLNPVLRIGVIVQMVERRNDDLECWTILVPSPLYATIFFQKMIACWHTLYATIFFQKWSLVGILVSGKILIFSVFVSCFYRKDPALIWGCSFTDKEALYSVNIRHELVYKCIRSFYDRYWIFSLLRWPRKRSECVA